MLSRIKHSEEKARRQSDAKKTAKGVLLIGPIAIVLGILVILAYGSHAAKVDSFLSLFGTLLLVALASVMTGGFIGFIFGIPKITPASSNQTAREEPTEQHPADDTADVANQAPVQQSQGAIPNDSRTTSHHVNTNLEEISDWLTKIIVGISLVEFKNIIGLVETISNKIQGSFKPVCSQETAECFLGLDIFSGAMIVLFFIIGVHFGYLWTRLLVQGAIKDADLSLIGHLEQTVEQQREDIIAKQKQEKADKTAIETVNRQLEGTTEPISLGELKNIIGRSTRETRATIFYRARNFRQTYEQTDPNILSRAVPVFRALIRIDEEETAGKPQYHRNYSQLGYILKNMEPPDYDEAIIALTDAIKLRPGAQNKYYALYEYNRAHCLIKADKNFKANKKSEEDLKKQITSDLAAAKANSWIREHVIPSDSTIEQWMKLNDVSFS